MAHNLTHLESQNNLKISLYQLQAQTNLCSILADTIVIGLTAKAGRQPLMEMPSTVTINRWRALPLRLRGNSKIELVKSVTIHGGKCLAFTANANEAHASKTEQG